MATPLSFSYTAGATTDALSLSVYAHFTKVSRTLALDPAGHNVFVHGNGLITVRRGSAVVSDRYTIYRLRRVWTRPLAAAQAPAGDPAGPYVAGGARFESDGQPIAPGKWFDVPGWMVGTRFHECERSLHEWVVGAQDPATGGVLHDAGCLYFIAVIDLTPEFYRVRMSTALTLGEADWRAIQGLGGTSPMSAAWPYRDEAAAGPTAIGWADNTDWQPWGTYNGQLPEPSP